MENKNWLYQLGYGDDFRDSEVGNAYGIPKSDWGTSAVNRQMLDRVHEMNVEGYLSEGIELKKAKHMADKRRSMALKSAKDAGLKL